MKENKGIIIETEKVILFDGSKGRKITKLKALRWAILPVEYKSKMPNFFYHKANGCFYIAGGRCIFSIGMKIAEKLFQNELVYIREAGNRLLRINKELKLNKERETWKGVETFKI